MKVEWVIKFEKWYFLSKYRSIPDIHSPFLSAHTAPTTPGCESLDEEEKEKNRWETRSREHAERFWPYFGEDWWNFHSPVLLTYWMWYRSIGCPLFLLFLWVCFVGCTLDFEGCRTRFEKKTLLFICCSNFSTIHHNLYYDALTFYCSRTILSLHQYLPL